MVRKLRRKSRNYDGTDPTGYRLKDVLPVVLRNIGGVYGERGDLVLAAWPEIIGQQLAAMTEAVSFKDGLLMVNVKNSTLFTLLRNHERERLLKSLRNKFPKTKINNIFFRMG
jgi:hypothetical protein